MPFNVSPVPNMFSKVVLTILRLDERDAKKRHHDAQNFLSSNHVPDNSLISQNMGEGRIAFCQDTHVCMPVNANQWSSNAIQSPASAHAPGPTARHGCVPSCMYDLDRAEKRMDHLKA